MKKKLYVFFLLISICSIRISKACDACGGLATRNVGLLTAYKANFVGIGWQVARSHAGQERKTHDAFHTLELFARISLSDRVKLLLHQPYRMNSRTTEQERITIEGVGDTRLLINYVLVNDFDLGNDFSLYAEAAAGVKLPTGAYDEAIHHQNIPENFNIGNGSMGYIIQPAFVISKGGAGVVVNAFYQYFSKSKSNYQFGSQAGGQVAAYNQYRLSDQLNLVPNVGASFEALQSDKYANRITVHGTGGNGGFALMACQIKHMKWVFGGSMQLPIWSNYSDGEADVKTRYSCQLNFIF